MKYDAIINPFLDHHFIYIYIYIYIYIIINNGILFTQHCLRIGGDLTGMNRDKSKEEARARRARERFESIGRLIKMKNTAGKLQISRRASIIHRSARGRVKLALHH